MSAGDFKVKGMNDPGTIVNHGADDPCNSNTNLYRGFVDWSNTIRTFEGNRDL